MNHYEHFDLVCQLSLVSLLLKSFLLHLPLLEELATGSPLEMEGSGRGEVGGGKWEGGSGRGEVGGGKWEGVETRRKEGRGGLGLGKEV